MKDVRGVGGYHWGALILEEDVRVCISITVKHDLLQWPYILCEECLSRPRRFVTFCGKQKESSGAL